MPNFNLHTGNCLEVLKEFPDNCIDSIVTDPPYGLSFMGKKWDYDVPSVDIWRECLRVLKPGGHLLSFAGTRTQHRMAINIEDAGFEIRDMIAWVYGCLSEDTETFTKSGWSKYQEAKGSEVLAYDVELDTYLWEQPSRWNEYHVESDTAYHIHSDCTDQVVSKGHRCIVERGGSLAFVSAEQLSEVEKVPYLQNHLMEVALQHPEVPKWGMGPFVLEPGFDKGMMAKSYKTSLATVTPVEYTGLIWCPTVSTGAFVARRNGKVFITGNSGFPKSLDVSKAIDKAAGAKRQVTGISPNDCPNSQVKSGKGFDRALDQGQQHKTLEITAPATEAARQWEGFGTSLKPALEPITVARKPLIGTVAENVLRHGTGALNIDGCRVEASDAQEGPTRHGGGIPGNCTSWELPDHKAPIPAGRFPANITHDGSNEVVGLFPHSKSTGGQSSLGAFRNGDVFGKGKDEKWHSDPGYGDSGSAARFFYCAKCNKKDRNEGLDGVEKKKSGVGALRDNGRESEPRANYHPTVKPTDLMRYLCRLVTPPGGTVLDPFMGSGSTGKAAIKEGFDFIGIDMDETYVEIAEKRIAHACLPEFPKETKKGAK